MEVEPEHHYIFKGLGSGSNIPDARPVEALKPIPNSPCSLKSQNPMFRNILPYVTLSEKRLLHKLDLLTYLLSQYIFRIIPLGKG